VRLTNCLGCRVSEVASAISTVPRVAIAIVATDEAKNLVGRLGSLRSLIYEYSVVICENGGHEAFERHVQELCKVPGMAEAEAEADDRLGAAEGRRFHLGDDRRVVRLLRSRENRGYAGGVNFCIAAAGTDWDFIWVLNPDTFPEPDALRALVRRQAEGGYGIVGSKIVFVADGRVQLWGGLKYIPLLGRARSLGHGEPAEVTPDLGEVEKGLDIVAGTTMFVSKDYIKTIGVMDEDLFVFNEDTEWSLRRGKFRLGYAHDSIVHHVAGATSGSGGHAQSGRGSVSTFPREIG
jgi:N-acetylglucosaminyl-diphospho-decaprenol L-rhamnosyltransferase